MITLLPSPSLRVPQSDASLPHVLLIADQFPKALGGGERIVLKLAALLPLYGFRASILTFAVHPESSALAAAPCPIYLLPLTRTYDLAAFKAAFALRGFIRDRRVQIVQTFFESSDIWGGFVTRSLTSAKLIWSRRDMGILRAGKHHLAYRLMARMPHAVFAVSNLVRQHGIDVDGIEPARIRTIYNGLNLSDWLATPRPQRLPGEVLIATAGNIRHVKGHDIFIRAAAIVVTQVPQANFSIAGEVLETAYFAGLQTLVTDLGLTDRFHFSGGISDLRGYLSQADIFVLPSRSEGFSNAIVEAMAAGLPVIATNVGGNAEAVADGSTGLIIPTEDPEALAEAILLLIADPARAQAMGAKGREVAADRFTTEAMMTATTGAYRNLLSGKPPFTA
jgi:glycosyltransferase involved in cell wall biosynthesis